MKQRISSLDLQILSKELKTQLEGYRLSNIYNIADSSRQFLLKFGKPDSKLNAIIDCGLRIHLTDFSRPIPPAPSGFVVKLRKHLKSKRLTTVKRVVNDRILVLSFSDGLYFLVLEFFSAGNVILLDSERNIIALQRIVHEYENKVGHKYEMFDETFLDDVSLSVPDIQNNTESSVSSWLQEAALKAQTKDVISDRKKGSRVLSIHKLLFVHAPHLSSDLISRNLRMNGINPSTSCLDFEDKLSTIVEILNTTESEVHELLSAGSKCGFIVAKENPYYDPAKDAKDTEFIYEQFHPFHPFLEEKNERLSKIIEIEGDYNKTVDNYFSTIESSKYALRIQNQEQLAKKRLDDARQENEKRIKSLIDVQSSNEQRGHLIIANSGMVEEAQCAVRGLVDQQMDWNTIEKIIASEQLRQNKVAQLIQLPLDLKNNKITLRLPLPKDVDDTLSSEESEEVTDSSESDASDVSDFETEESVANPPAKDAEQKHNDKTRSQPHVSVIIDLTLSSFANASNYFNIKKSTLEKQKKVEKNANKALKNIEQKIEKDLKKKLKESHDTLRKTRTPYFFEKYNWFLSSEGFLVLMGKSGAETDQLYSRYITDRDIYISSSFETQVWIKNPDGTEIPPNTLMQAGVMCMSASPAWSKKIQSSPWWCFASNLSKFDDVDGSLLPVGTFNVKEESEKVFLPPAQLVMGFSFLWKTKADTNGLIVSSDESSNETDNSEHENDVEEDNLPENPMVQEISGKIEQISIDTEDQYVIGVSSKQSVDDLQEFADTNDFSDTSSANPVVQNLKKKVRGKKGKLKKIQKKYADQDDEERRLRLEALGTLKGVEKEQMKIKETISKQQERDAKKARREKQREQQAIKFTENEKEVVNYKGIFSELKTSVGKDDEILAIIPCFAPWAALTKYKYKVKIQPGTGKKSKSINDILAYFMKRKVDDTESDKELDWPREHEFVKQLKATELVSLFYVDKLKINIPGQTDPKYKGKNGNSKGRKGASK